MGMPSPAQPSVRSTPTQRTLYSEWARGNHPYSRYRRLGAQNNIISSPETTRSSYRGVYCAQCLPFSKQAV